MKEGWKYKRLGDVATYINGFAFKPEDWTTEGLPIIRIQNLTESSKVYNYCKRQDIPDKFHVFDGDVLISWSATLGVFEWNGGEALLNQHIFKVVFDKEIINKQYYKYAILISIAEMSKHTNGATMRHIRKGNFDNIKIPVPPLSEQERIVAFLDAEFEKIDQLKANAEQQLQAAKDLFQAALKEMLTPKEGWKSGVLGDIATILHGKNQKEVISEQGKYPIYGSGGNIMGYASEYLCDEGTTILGRKGTINNPIFVSEKFWNVDTAFGIIANGADKKFLYYRIKHENWQERNTGTTLPSLTQSVVLSVPIWYPSIDEQKVIADKLDEISEKVKSLQSNYDKTLTLCNDLKQALLKSIFE